MSQLWPDGQSSGPMQDGMTANLLAELVLTSFLGDFSFFLRKDCLESTTHQIEVETSGAIDINGNAGEAIFRAKI